MLMKTHMAIAVFFILLFVNSVSSKLVFIFIMLIATLIPDLDSGFSTIGNSRVARIFQIFVTHRGVFHSFTFCIIVSILLAAFVPVLALPFFFGYSLHLFSDSFTREGIKPFWPWSKTSSWLFRTGGLFETNLLIVFTILDILVFVLIVSSIF